MFNEKHNLVTEFPEHKEQIHTLKEQDAHFRRLFDEYGVIDDMLHRVIQQIETPADEVVEALKKMRVALKDELYFMLKNAMA